MKTIEEAANEFATRYAPVLWEEQCRSYFKAGVEFAQRWIPVEEELPEPVTFVIVKKSNGRKLGMFFDVDKQFMFGEESNQTSQITHWRPIELK